MNKWPEVAFESLASKDRWSFTIGPFGSKVTTQDYKTTGIPFIRGINLASGIFLDDEFVYIDEEKAGEVESAIVVGGDLIFTRKGTVGQVSMVPHASKFDRYVISGSQMKARLDTGRSCPQFYYYWFKSPVGQSRLLANASAVGVPSIPNSLATLREIRVPIPPLSEQQKIVALLGALDDKIAVNDRIARTSRELGHALFAGCLKANTLQVVELAEVAAAITRGITPKYSDDGDAVVVVNQKCVRDGRVALGPARKTLPEKVREPKMLRRDDVLVNSTGVGTLGRVARWTLGMRATTDTHVTIVRFDSAKVDPVCGGFALLAAQPDIEALGEGSTGQTELSRKRLGEYQIALPSLEAMQQLRPDLDFLEAKGEAAMEESKALAELRDALLPKLMSGQVGIRDVEKVVEDAV
ncbi:restriction endonuclease subunit S [Actinomadura sp. LOL_016]|uniref:restriction endonuclease subunit S n=1 Tax=unclassified Actinomadura TaxID=2626254 RepID=UPI003A80B0C6